MRGRICTIRAIARAAGYAAVAAAIAATVLHVRHNDMGAFAPLLTSSSVSDPLAPELAHCLAIGMAVQSDVTCEAVWAENRRRFFTDHSADGVTRAPTPDPKPVAKSDNW